MIRPQPRPIRKRDKDYLAWIREQRCLVHRSICGSPTIEAQHVREEGQGGIGTKPDDSRTVPLCTYAHHLYHEYGRKWFETEYRVNLEAAIQSYNYQYAQTHPKPKRERTLKPRVYSKKTINRGWAVFNPHFNFPVVATLEEAQSLKAKRGGRIRRVQVKAESMK